MRAVVVGAGPTALFTAIALVRRGWQVVVVAKWSRSHWYTTGPHRRDELGENAKFVRRCNEYGPRTDAFCITKQSGGFMVKFGFHARIAAIVGGAALATLVAAAPSALAQPAPPVPLPEPVLLSAPAPGPAPVPTAPGEVHAPPFAAAPADPLSAPPAVALGADGVPHLASPDNLPPGTSVTPTPQAKLGYFRDLWHAMRTQEVSGSDALLLLTQRPMSSSAGMPVGPQPAPAPVAPPLVPAPLAP